MQWKVNSGEMQTNGIQGQNFSMLPKNQRIIYCTFSQWKQFLEYNKLYKIEAVWPNIEEGLCKLHSCEQCIVQKVL